MERQSMLRDQALMNRLLEICMTYLKTQEYALSSSIVPEVENWIKNSSGQGLSKLKMVIWPTEDTDTGADGYHLPACLFLQIKNQTGMLSVEIDGTNSSSITASYMNTTKTRNG